MPQLDTVYILMVYLWTWTMLYMTTQKIKTTHMTTDPMIKTTLSKSTPTLLWL